MASFAYIPALHGLDATTWRTMFGGPLSVVSNYLHLTGAQIVTNSTFYRGEAAFRVNVPSAPTVGIERQIGFYNPSEGSYAMFHWKTDGELYGVVRNRTHASTIEYTADGVGASDSIEWSSSWTSVDITMKVRWEAGMVRFFIEDTLVATVSNLGPSWNVAGEYPSYAIPTMPLSLVVSNSAGDVLKLKSITSVGIQEIYTPEDIDSTVFTENLAYEGDSLSIAESVSVSVT